MINITLSGLVQAQCFSDTITSPVPFMGNNDEIFKISDGSLWQVKYEYEYLYVYYPDIVICPNEGMMIIDDTTLSIIPLTNGYAASGFGAVIESQIDGDFEGWEGDTIYKLMNGQIWQQVSYEYEYSYGFMPNVIIFQKNGSNYMKVDGVNSIVQVQQLR
ncbi:hypothetical protein [Orrella daihaiensis]|uniref:WG repeat-containing protein n=1 Tax=Orrella daihaiensis TaxID=2782176 RepID=A0ABY4AKA3_9BURK|nr:hypothetical protein [Orrella daihaiensis]UOD50699.1 hypothetical protein DHf2319_01835 [Orrella daihaiensis]